jgi:hypothetical protein
MKNWWNSFGFFLSIRVEEDCGALPSPATDFFLHLWEKFGLCPCKLSDVYHTNLSPFPRKGNDVVVLLSF